MPACPDCGVVTLQTTRFCPSCGRDNQPVAQYQTSKPYPFEQKVSTPRAQNASKGLDQIFGIDPRIAFLAFIVDLMLFGTTAASGGLTLPLVVPLAIAAGIMLGRITYKAQMKWYGDDSDSAMIKASIIGLLTAIPVGIPALVWVPSGILGLVHNARKKLTLSDHT